MKKQALVHLLSFCEQWSFDTSAFLPPSNSKARKTRKISQQGCLAVSNTFWSWFFDCGIAAEQSDIWETRRAYHWATDVHGIDIQTLQLLCEGTCCLPSQQKLCFLWLPIARTAKKCRETSGSLVSLLVAILFSPNFSSQLQTYLGVRTWNGWGFCLL